METYAQIQDYVRSKYGYTVKSCWIAHMKEQMGIKVSMSARRYDSNSRVCPCPEDKQDAIIDAFRYFDMIN